MRFLKQSYSVATSQFGFDPWRALKAVAGLPRYARDFYRFRASYGGPMGCAPCLHDREAEGGAAGGEYFWQDLYVARKIYAAAPAKHVDIGSRVDGFVAHVASFREIEVFDVRPISAKVPGVIFRQADLMDLSMALTDYCDSLSCLHALEHFGLGRYGDPIDRGGHERGLGNMARMLRGGGVFYLSVPVGTERVEFNAHRIFDPRTIVGIAAQNRLVLNEFAFVEPRGGLVEAAIPDEVFMSLRQSPYALGIFTFKKRSDP